MFVELRNPGKDPERHLNAIGKMRCPVCEVSLTMSDRQGAEIDFCQRCRGVWLDRGELDKIIERRATEIAPPSRQPYRCDYDDDRGGHGHCKHGGYGKHGSRRKSWLMEIFD